MLKPSCTHTRLESENSGYVDIVCMVWYVYINAILQKSEEKKMSSLDFWKKR